MNKHQRVQYFKYYM